MEQDCFDDLPGHHLHRKKWMSLYFSKTSFQSNVGFAQNQLKKRKGIPDFDSIIQHTTRINQREH
jgi:hypothetical protein